MTRFCLILTILFFSLSNGWTQQIDSIKFNGLTKTNPEYLTALIECKVGSELDSMIVEQDVQTLKNLNLFFSVDYSRHINPNGNYNLTFEIVEAVYLYPILSVSGFKGQLKIQAGANQINFLGKAQSIGFQYQFYDRHSFSLFYTAPKHSNGKTGHEIALNKYSTIEPLYFSDTVSNFNFDNYSASLGGFYWINQKFRLGLGGMYMYETYHKLDKADMEFTDDVLLFNKFQVRFQANFNSINQHFEFRDGISVSLFTETIQTQGTPEASFFKAVTEIQYFKRIGKKGNVGIQNRIGVSTNNFSPFAPFVLDGFMNVRGIGNRVARGTGELIINTEYRHTLLKKKYFILQLVALSDFGSLRPPGGDISSVFKRDNLNVFVGGGLRLHSRLIYKSIFRLDYAINPIDPHQGGFTFGLGQFF